MKQKENECNIQEEPYIYILMILLRTLLKEGIDIAKNRYAWLTPDGRFLPVLSGTHAEFAYKNIRPSNKAIDEAWTLGYMRITFQGAVLMAHNEKMPPNDKQKKALINLAIECGDAAVEYDYGDDYKTLWSIHDTI